MKGQRGLEEVSMPRAVEVVARRASKSAEDPEEGSEEEEDGKRCSGGPGREREETKNSWTEEGMGEASGDPGTKDSKVLASMTSRMASTIAEKR